MPKKGDWTDEERDYVRENWADVPPRQIAEHLNRHMLGVISQARALGLIQMKPRKKGMKRKVEEIEPDEMSALNECYRALEPLGDEARKRCIMALRVLLGLVVINPAQPQA